MSFIVTCTLDKSKCPLIMQNIHGVPNPHTGPETGCENDSGVSLRLNFFKLPSYLLAVISHHLFMTAY